MKQILRLGLGTALFSSALAMAQVPLWQRDYTAGAMTTEAPVDIVVDASGNIYSVGTTGSDVCVASYTAGGTLRWSTTYAGPGGGADVPAEAIIDGTGNLVVVGTGSKTANLNAFMVLKFNSATGGLMWSQLYSENDPIFGDVSGPGKGITVGPGGFLYACGAIEVFNEFYDALVLRLNPTTGAVVTTTTYGLPAASNQIAEDIVWDGVGAVYAVGSTADNSAPYSPDVSNAFLAKYNGSLGSVWIKTFDGYGKADYGLGVLSRYSINAVYILTNFTTDPATYPEIGLIRVNSISGAQVWRRTRATASDVRTGKMVLDNLGFITVLARMDMFSTMVKRWRSTDGFSTWEKFRDGFFDDLVSDASANAYIVGQGTGKLDLNGNWKWFSPVNGTACALNASNVLYSNAAEGGNMRTMRWYQATYSLAVSPTSTTGGYNVTGTVSSSSTAPTGGLPFTLNDDSPYVTVPSTTTIAAGTTSRSFTITTGAVPGTTPVITTLSASCFGASATTTLTLLPPVLVGLTIAPETVTGGSSATGRVALSGIAPPGGKLVSLRDNSPFVATPSGVLVGTGNATRTFTITTSAVTSETNVTVQATLDGVSKTATFTLSP